MIEHLEKALNYKFKNIDLLTAALTHKSYGEGLREGCDHNERLEFLGDAVVGLVITEYIFRKFKDLNEGDLAKFKAHLVSSDCMYQLAVRIHLSDYILLGKGEEKNKGRNNKKIVSSTLEALIGAVYLDTGYRSASAVVLHLYKDLLSQWLDRDIRINDYKSELQELIQKHKNTLPVYRVLEERGKPPEMVFVVGVYLDNMEIGKGRGRSKKEAEQEAAQKALKTLNEVFDIEKLSDVFFMRHNPT